MLPCQQSFLAPSREELVAFAELQLVLSYRVIWCREPLYRLERVHQQQLKLQVPKRGKNCPGWLKELPDGTTNFPLVRFWMVCSFISDSSSPRFQLVYS